MAPEVESALIAVTGVLVSIAVSIWQARRTARDETRKVRAQHSGAYATRLLETRLLKYPELYSYVSGFIKHVEGGSLKHLAGQPIAKADVEQLLNDLVAWDTSHAILLSDRGVRAIFALRQFLIVRLRPQEDVHAALAERALQQEFLLLAAQLEIALKEDMGVYEVEGYEARDYPRTYAEVTHRLRRLPQ